MTTTQKKVIDTLNKESEQLKGDKILDQFIEANKEFDELVNKGLVKKRGNQLMSISDSHFNRHVFNAS